MPPYSRKEEPRAGVAGEPVPSAAVREQLARIVNSPKFIPSTRLRRFLTHIVERTIEGDLDNLKEFSVAMEVFDRRPDYDPNIDAIVRVEARRLRAKLKAYYEEGPGTADPVLIALRPGSYVPIFRWLHAEQASKQEEQTRDVALPERTSVAVLPFVNMSPEPEQDYFCDGITEEIINSLTRLSGLNVIARTSAFQFKSVAIDVREVGQRLGADLIIEGSVRKAGEQLRITAQAVHTKSGHHLWSETFRRELKDVFAIQEEIANCVADLLRVHIRPVRPLVRPSTRNVDAYTGYLRARSLLYQQSPEAVLAALEQLRELIAAYPDFALGYTGIAVVNVILSIFGFVSGRDVYPEANRCAERGYALDPDSGETCAVLAAVRSSFEQRWEDAEMLCERATTVQPGHALAYTVQGMALLCQGKISAAEAMLHRSTELDPLSAGDCARIAYVHYVKGDDAAAEEQLQHSFDRDKNCAEARFYQGLLQFRRQDFEDVVKKLSRSAAPLDIGLLAAAHARQNRVSRAEASIERLARMATVQYITPLATALAAIGMKDHDLAFQRLEQAVDHKTNFVNMLGIEPFFEPLRPDGRFRNLLKRLNLTQ